MCIFSLAGGTQHLWGRWVQPAQPHSGVRLLRPPLRQVQQLLRLLLHPLRAQRGTLWGTAAHLLYLQQQHSAQGGSRLGWSLIGIRSPAICTFVERFCYTAWLFFKSINFIWLTDYILRKKEHLSFIYVTKFIQETQVVIPKTPILYGLIFQAWHRLLNFDLWWKKQLWL